MLLGVVYSGTRTATLMVISGVVLFALMTINSRRTLIISFVAIGSLAFCGVHPFL
jgi:hypothetical protein